MKIFITSLLLILCLTSLPFSRDVKNIGYNLNIHYGELPQSNVDLELSTQYSRPGTLVLQIFPGNKMGEVQVGERKAQSTFAIIYIPNPNLSEGTISCPLTYFQENASISGGWIIDDNGRKVALTTLLGLDKIIITKKVGVIEEKINLSEKYCSNLLKYFLLEVPHFPNLYFEYDCYAFISVITDIEFNKLHPPFKYESRSLQLGDIVVLSSAGQLPNSIKHWAIFLGENLYLSKFGMSGHGASALVDVMDLKGMLDLYECNNIYVARSLPNAKPWSGLMNTKSNDIK